MRTKYVLAVFLLIVVSVFMLASPQKIAKGDYSTLTYSGSITLTTTTAYNNAAFGVSETRSCTVTIPFDNLTMMSGFFSDGSILTGTVQNISLSFSGYWSAQPTGDVVSEILVSVDPSSGQFSGTVTGTVYAIYEHGEVFLGLFPSTTPDNIENGFSTTVTRSIPNSIPYWHSSDGINVVHPFIDAEYAMANSSGIHLSAQQDWTTLFNALYSSGKIMFSVPNQSRNIPFAGTTYNAGSEVDYTGNLELQTNGGPSRSGAPFVEQLVILVVIVLAIIIAIAVVAAKLRKRRVQNNRDQKPHGEH